MQPDMFSQEESIRRANAARAKLAKPQKSRGLGDTVAKVFRATGIDSLAKSVLGSGCGCSKRQNWLNKIVPYSQD